MLQKKSKYQSKVYRDFKTLDKRNFHAIVRFYEEHLPKINQLRFEEAFVMQLSYAMALSEVGLYEKHLYVADNIIETSIFNNIQFHQGEDIYLKTLLQKAQSFYQLQRFSEAEHILKELIKLSPTHKTYPKLLRQCLAKDGAVYLQSIQSAGIFMVLIFAGLWVINILVIRNFFLEYTLLSNLICWLGIISGASFLVISSIIKRVRVQGKVGHFQKTVFEEKKKLDIQI